MPETAVEKLLRCSEGSLVQFLGTFDELKLPSELTVKGVGVISRHIKTTALCGSFRSECAHNHMAAGPHCSHSELDISFSLFRCD